MQKILFLTLLTVISIQGQDWEGSYTVNNQCTASLCCCPTGTVTISVPSANNLNFALTVSGTRCNGATSLSETISTPTGYTTSLYTSSSSVNDLDFRLSQNDQLILVIFDRLPQCKSLLVFNNGYRFEIQSGKKWSILLFAVIVRMYCSF
jgi:hypothetical protein